MSAYTEPLHVILDALQTLEGNIANGHRPWVAYESAFDIEGILPGPSEGEYCRAIAIAGHYIRLMIDADLPLDKAFRLGKQYG